MIRGENSRLVVVGFSVAAIDAAGRVCTKTPIASYLNRLGRHYSELIWFAPLLETNALHFTSEIQHPNFRFMRIAPGRIWERYRSLLAAASGAVVLVHMPTGLGWLFGYRLLRWRAKCVVAYIGDDFVGAAKGARGFARMKQALIGFAYRGLLSLANGVIARGRYLAEVAKRHNSKVIETAPLSFLEGNEGAIFGPERQAPGAEILYIGKMLRSKGVAELVLAYARLKRRLGPVIGNLNMVGDGPDLASIRTLAASEGVLSHVVFAGYVNDRSAINGILDRCMVLVVPTTSHPEGVPRVIEEAQAKGLAVVATTVGGIAAEFQGGEVVLVRPGDVDALASAVGRLIEDPVLYQQTKEAAERRLATIRARGNPSDQHHAFIESLFSIRGGRCE